MAGIFNVAVSRAHVTQASAVWPITSILRGLECRCRHDEGAQAVWLEWFVRRAAACAVRLGSTGFDTSYSKALTLEDEVAPIAPSGNPSAGLWTSGAATDA